MPPPDPPEVPLFTLLLRGSSGAEALLAADITTLRGTASGDSMPVYTLGRIGVIADISIFTAEISGCRGGPKALRTQPIHKNTNTHFVE